MSSVENGAESQILTALSAYCSLPYHPDIAKSTYMEVLDNDNGFI